MDAIEGIVRRKQRGQKRCHMVHSISTDGSSEKTKTVARNRWCRELLCEVCPMTEHFLLLLLIL